jgi:hypothetical protein
MPRQLITILCIFFLGTATAHAQEGSGVTRVAVVSFADDMVGQSLVYEVKEEFRDSSRFKLVENNNAFRVLISTMPKEKGNKSISTIYSVKWIFVTEEKMLPYYIDSSMGYCGRDVVESSARSIVASTDQVLSDLQDYFQFTQESNQY